MKLTEEQKQFIRNNFLKMEETEMASVLGTTRFHVQKFKRNEGLAKYHWNRVKKQRFVLKENIFNVDLLRDWVA